MFSLNLLPSCLTPLFPFLTLLLTTSPPSYKVQFSTSFDWRMNLEIYHYWHASFGIPIPPVIRGALTAVTDHVQPFPGYIFLIMCRFIPFLLLCISTFVCTQFLSVFLLQLFLFLHSVLFTTPISAPPQTFLLLPLFSSVLSFCLDFRFIGSS